MSTTSRLRSASPELIIRPVANGYVVVITRENTDRFGGLAKELVSPSDTYVFSGATSETALGDFVESHFGSGRAHLVAPPAMDDAEYDLYQPLPDLPSGFARWERRGRGWCPLNTPLGWAVLDLEEPSGWSVVVNEGKLPHLRRNPVGNHEALYLEAVK